MNEALDTIDETFLNNSKRAIDGTFLFTRNSKRRSMAITNFEDYLQSEMLNSVSSQVKVNVTDRISELENFKNSSYIRNWNPLKLLKLVQFGIQKRNT